MADERSRVRGIRAQSTCSACWRAARAARGELPALPEGRAQGCFGKLHAEEKAAFLPKKKNDQDAIPLGMASWSRRWSTTVENLDLVSVHFKRRGAGKC